MAITPWQKRKYLDMRAEGYSMRQSAKGAKIALSTGAKLERETGAVKGTALAEARSYEKYPGPIPYDDLSDEAARALEDFAYFQKRYFGRVPMPWQVEAANRMIELLETDEEEYVVVNAPPGSGKTLCFCHDIPAWMIMKNRAVRILMGSVTRSLAERNTARLKRTFERTVPEKANPMDLNRGWAFDAEATLSEDFGRIKPLDRDVWTRDAMVVMQHDDYAISEKEPTLSSYGMDTAFIGGLYNTVIWDDLVDPKKIRTVEGREQLEDMWTDVGETRLEPGGLCVLQGQRISSDDLYRYCLDMVAPSDEEDFDDEDQWHSAEHMGERLGKKYHHIVFKAHYEDRCAPENHKRSSPSYPDGCLLVPQRITWRKVRTWQENKGERFRVLYQQEDIDPDEVLVPAAWVWGAGEFPGCIDKDRSRLEIPDGIVLDRCFSVASADPSPTNYWSVQWWIYDPESEMRWLIDLLNKRMDAPDFLDWNTAEHRFDGVMEDWQQASIMLGAPITTWIVEQNAAQRFLLQYDHVKRWQALHSVDLLPHTTSRNKSDPDFGLQAMRPHWRYGRVRLPGRDPGRTSCTMKLVDEITKYPHARTDDNVMAEWFFEWQLPNLVLPPANTGGAWRPSWMRGAA